MKEKRNWTKPVVTRVKLDPRQAVMQVCSAGPGLGAWIGGGGSSCYYGTKPATTGTAYICATSPRGSIHSTAFQYGSYHLGGS